jgi:3-oxoacyl-(acyl-carrier-protein) synthase
MTTAELAVHAEVEWPRDEEPSAVPGFVVSSFSPLVSELANRCLAARAPAGDRTGIVLVTASGDAESAAHVAAAVDSGARVGPLLFFQSVPNSVAGHVAARWGLRGPVLCVSPVGEPRAEGIAQAGLLIEDGDADEVLVVLVEQTRDAIGGSAFLVSEGESR